MASPSDPHSCVRRAPFSDRSSRSVCSVSQFQARLLGVVFTRCFEDWTADVSVGLRSADGGPRYIGAGVPCLLRVARIAARRESRSNRERDQHRAVTVGKAEWESLAVASAALGSRGMIFDEDGARRSHKLPVHAHAAFRNTEPFTKKGASRAVHRGLLRHRYLGSGEVTVGFMSTL